MKSILCTVKNKWHRYSLACLLWGKDMYQKKRQQIDRYKVKGTSQIKFIDYANEAWLLETVWDLENNNWSDLFDSFSTDSFSYIMNLIIVQLCLRLTCHCHWDHPEYMPLHQWLASGLPCEERRDWSHRLHRPSAGQHRNQSCLIVIG